jgi:hypothetical protein
MLDIPLLKKDFELPRIRHTKQSINILNPKILVFFNKRNLYISLVEIFYSCPFFESRIHIDGESGDYTKINFIYGCTDGVMTWYTEKIKKPAVENSIGLSHCIFQHNEVSRQFSKKVNVALLQVGVPHSVENFQNDRWAVCLVYRDKTTRQRLTMLESKNI